MNERTRSDQTVHLICQAHIDPVWIWDWPEGLTETLATFETAVTLLDEHPDFVFNHNESLLYEWTKRFRPELFERIRGQVASGRWVISGGWFLQPDMNLPSGESIARHILLGRRFFRDEFDAEPRVAYNLDTFGHNANTPQFLALSGTRMYVHFRPLPEELELPASLYRWRGVDGTEVVAYRPECGWYCSRPGSLVEQRIVEMHELSQETGRPATAFWGAGNHGGGATRRDLQATRDAHERGVPVLHSSMERYWREVVEPIAEGLPVYEGELQKCFTGCYTSVIPNKLNNRRGEGALLAAERFAALAWWLCGADYPHEALRAAWKDLLFTHFHDMLPGSSIREGVVSSADFVGRAVLAAREVLLRSQLELMRSRDRKEPLTIRIFNAHARECTVAQIVDVQLATHPYLMVGKHITVVDRNGAEVVRQVLAYRNRTSEWRVVVLFQAELPPMGLAEYRIIVHDGSAVNSGEHGSDEHPDAAIEAHSGEIHDPYPGGAVAPWVEAADERIVVRAARFTASVSRADGSLTLTDTRGAYLRDGSFRLVVREDSNNAWGGDRYAYGRALGYFACPDRNRVAAIMSQPGTIDAVRVIASGPLAIVVESIVAFGESTARVRYTVHRNIAAIDVELVLLWAERQRVAQVELRTAFGGAYSVEIPHAAITRSGDGGELPAGRWIGVGDGERALAIVNDGPGGMEREGAIVRQTLVRSPVYSSGGDATDPAFLGDHMDLGEHRYRFRLLFGAPHDVEAERQLAADDLCFPDPYHVSVPLEPSARSGIEPGATMASIVPVHGSGFVHLEAMKRSEDGEALVVRLAERTGRAARVRFEMAGVEAMELEFRAYEMKTLRAPKAVGQSRWSLCDLLEDAYE